MPGTLKFSGEVELAAAAKGDLPQGAISMVLALKDSLNLSVTKFRHETKVLSATFAELSAGLSGTCLVAMTDGSAVELRFNGSEVLPVDGLLIVQPPSATPFTSIEARVPTGTASLEFIIVQ